MKHLLLRIGLCIAVFGFFLYAYLAAQNELTQLKMQIPETEKEIAALREEHKRLAYEVDRFQSPSHLMELARRPEFSYLKHPMLKEVLTVPEALVSNEAP